jgi:polyphosphate kinase
MMDEQIAVAKSGGNGYIAAKINSLCDGVIMNKLVEASQAGVKIELVVRGLCCLIAGVPGYTDNITVRSIVGRFLEHSRIFIFGAEGRDQKIYIGSADYMSRNTIRRVEVAAPIEDERLKKRIREMFAMLLRDTVKARIQQSDGSYSHITLRREGDVKFNSQEYFYEEAYKRLEDKKSRQETLRQNRESAAEKKTDAKRGRPKKADKPAEKRSRTKKAAEPSEKPVPRRGRPKKNT